MRARGVAGGRRARVARESGTMRAGRGREAGGPRGAKRAGGRRARSGQAARVTWWGMTLTALSDDGRATKCPAAFAGKSDSFAWRVPPGVRTSKRLAGRESHARRAGGTRGERVERLDTGRALHGGG